MTELADQVRRRMVQENRIYILPSGAGTLFLLMVGVMILTAATYNNNLIFILSFFMFGLFVVSMLQTHYNLTGVELALLSVEDGFEEDSLGVNLQVRSSSRRPKRGLLVRPRGKLFLSSEAGRADLNARESLKPVRVLMKAPSRGIYSAPEFILETYYPLGLFRAWKIFRPQGEVVVYPRPAGARELHSAVFDQGQEELGLRTSPEGDFGELKPYQDGESYHQIAWKHFARTGQLLRILHWGQENRYYHIPWDIGGQSLEKYLQQMSFWIKQAVEENASFALDLPNTTIEAGSGSEHAKRCWRALASLPRELPNRRWAKGA